MPKTRPIFMPSGAVLQSGIPREVAEPPGEYHAIVRGVVIATYVTDDPSHPLLSNGRAPAAVYCDVVLYGSLSQGARFYTVYGAAVCQPMGALHSGTIYKPRAATRMLDGTPLSDVDAPDVSQMDGSHVLVSFLEGNRNQAVIVGELPHPSRDVGNSPLLPIGQRQKLRLVDGDPSLALHHGTYFGVADSGDFVADATRGNDGSLLPSGGEAPSGAGSVQLMAAALGCRRTQIVNASIPGAAFVITEETLAAGKYTLDAKDLALAFSLVGLGGNGLAVAGGGAAASAKVGDGSYHVALAEALQTYIDGQLATYLNTHTHPTGVGLSGPPTTPSPAYDPSITSGAVSVPSRSL